MGIVDFNTLVVYLTACTDQEQVRDLVLSYGNARHKAGIESAGQKARDFLSKINAIRGKRMKNSILNWDEENGIISLKEFTKYITGVEDELKEMVKHGDLAHANAATDISSIMWNKVGDLKVDRRLLFSNDDE